MERQKDFYDSLYKNTTGERDDVSYRQLVTKFQSIMKLVRKNKNRLKVLEIGCGDGLLTRLLLNEGFAVTSIDISGEAIKKVSARYEEECRRGVLIAIEADILAFLENIREEYDLIVGTGILHHIEKDDFMPLFRLASSRLSSGGFLVFITEPNGRKAYRLLWEKAAPFFYGFYKYDYKWEIEKGSADINIPVLRQMMKNSGFQEVIIKSYQAFPIFRLKFFFSLNKLMEKILNDEYALYISILARK